MSRAENKASRLLQVEALLLGHPEGLTQAEIARRLQVNRSTINRDLPDLPKHIYIDDDGRWKIDREAYLVNVRFNLHEALAVHLASRLLATRMDRQNPYAAAALRKLGVALEKLAPRISTHMQQSADMMDEAAQRHDPAYLQALEKLTLAWAEQRRVKIWHRHEDTGRVIEYAFSPYFIEPYAVGQSTHVIGWRVPPGAMRTFKVERIERVEITREPYEIPADFDPRELLADAWGIWYTEAEPVGVVLKFHPRVARRVQETRWHRSEKIEELPDGSIIWRAKVAEPQEMLPWIRGWGADVEVVEPEGLREALKKEARKMASLYEIEGSPKIPLYQMLWAKTNDEKTLTHPLICHMIDVAMTAFVLWKEALPDGIRADMANAVGLEIDSGGHLFAFWAGLHDLGKASRCFQQKYRPAITALKAKGLDFLDMAITTPCLHGHITCKTLEPLLIQETCLPEEWAKRVASAVGGHHGEWPTNLHAYTDKSLIGTKAWDKVRRQLFLRLKEILDPPRITPPAFLQIESNTFITLFSAFVSVADWLGSIEEYFQPYQGYVDLEEYARFSEGQAHKALQENGWLGWKPPQALIAFTDLCKVSSPRPLQQAVIDLSAQLNGPGLVLIEAPTGEGKTEAALYLADYWARTLQQRGAYVAMPTMATSNQMYKRVTQVLKRRYPDEKFVGYHLLHGNALLEENESVPRLTKVYADKDGNGNIGAASWFTKQKRGLLAPFAVGTVDQALLSILQTPHFFVRLFGLSHKTVIFDEVHAYDTYMDKLFFHLLGWLRAVGASVVILSATLPEATRRSIMEAYTGQTFFDLPSAPYPAITWTTGGRPQTIHFDASAPRDLWLEHIKRAPLTIAERLAIELSDGGCAAVLCNTVGRAQEVYRVIRDKDIVPKEDLHLFHARFPLEWRHRIEETVTTIFDNRASDAAPRRRSIVIATQVIEQSLDLDFDLMISDLAPVDLLLQRAGRLHRNPGRKNRPTALQQPRLLLAMPTTENSVPVFDKGDTAVYDRYFLLRSYLALQNYPKIEIPRQTRDLLEAVYGPEDRMPPVPSEDYRKALTDALRKMNDDHDDARYEAHKKLVRPPEDPDLLFSPITGLDEENPELHAYMRAATRQSPPSVTLICLHRTPDGLVLDPEPSGQVINPDEELDLPTTRALFGRKIEITNWYLVQYFTKLSPPPGWRKSPWLRHARCVEFDGGIFQPEGETWKLELDRKLGLVFD